MCNIFVDTALAWFALGQKLIRDAIGAAGRINMQSNHLTTCRFESGTFQLLSMQAISDCIMDSMKRVGQSTSCLKPHICNIFVHTALAWFALGQKLIRDAIGAAGRLDAPNATEY